MIKIHEIKAKSILNKSTISDYTLNCYRGCQHACAYCYAKYISYYTGHKEPWGTYVDVKINAPEILQKEVEKKRRGEVMMSSICDGWQPIEARYKLSRQCLEILLGAGFHASILTKNKLILRDFDIIEKHKNLVDLGLTITTFDHKLQGTLEPFSSSSLGRLNVIKEANKRGIKVWVFMGPLIPGFTDTFENICGLFDKLSKVELAWVYIDNFHYHGAQYKALEKSLGKIYPERFKAFLSPINYKKQADKYNLNLRHNLSKAARKYNLATPLKPLF